jgi:hypothetical protein
MITKRQLLGRVLLGLTLAACLTSGSKPRSRPGSAFDTAARPLDLIPPGTEIGYGPPCGWTHLLLKSQPRTGAGDVGQLSTAHANLAGMLFTALLADVQHKHGRYRLARVAVGVGTRVGDRDLILSPETQRRLGADLGFVARIVLSRAHEKLADIVTTARSPAMMVFDAPNLMLRQGLHRPVVLRYAVLVNEESGRLDTLVWLLDCEGDGRLCGPCGPVEWLSPSKVDDCVLHVDAREFTLGNPNEQSFALLRLPQGSSHPELPQPLRALASQPHLSEASAAELEVGLRTLLADVPTR